MIDVQLEPARREDLPFVTGCAEMSYKIYVQRIGKPPAPMVADFPAALSQGELEVISANGEKAGFLISQMRHGDLYVENVAVHPDFQGRGIAKALFSILEQRAMQNDLSAIELYTNEKMTENLAFYPKLGFAEINRRSEAGFNRVYFRKTL